LVYGAIWMLCSNDFNSLLVMQQHCYFPSVSITNEKEMIRT